MTSARLANPFARPCSDLVTPLLSEHDWRRRCGEWEAACLLAQLSRRWRACILEWRALAASVRLDGRASETALRTVSVATRLQCLDLTGCRIPCHLLGHALSEVARVTGHLHTLRLCACRFHDGIGAKSSSIFDFDWSVHWPNLTTLDVAGHLHLTDRDVMTLSVRLPRLTALNVTGGTLTSHAPLALLVEHRRSTLRELCIDDLGTTDRPSAPRVPSPSLVGALAACAGLEELHARGVPGLFGIPLCRMLEGLGRLVVLNLHSTLACAEHLDPIAALPALRRLCVADTHLETAIAAGSAAHCWPKITAVLARGWGCLAFRRLRAADPSVKWFGPEGDLTRVVSGGLFTVGRSRGSRLQIGQNWAHPYVSGTHYTLFGWLVWSAAGQPDAVEPWIRDMSQNGTYVNGKLVGAPNCIRLYDQDRVEVFLHQYYAERIDVELPTCVWQTKVP